MRILDKKLIPKVDNSQLKNLLSDPHLSQHLISSLFLPGAIFECRPALSTAKPCFRPFGLRWLEHPTLDTFLWWERLPKSTKRVRLFPYFGGEVLGYRGKMT